jgi:hypothetical protein
MPIAKGRGLPFGGGREDLADGGLVSKDRGSLAGFGASNVPWLEQSFANEGELVGRGRNARHLAGDMA